MPIGIFCDAAMMTQLKDLTDTDLEKEFREMEGGAEDEAEGACETGVVGCTSSTDRPSSSDSLKTNSAHSDQQSEDAGSNGDHNMPEAESKRGKSSRSSVWKTVKRAGGELNEDTRRVFRYIGSKLHSRHGPKETKVKEIRILPDADQDRWATRTAGSANSYSSSNSDPAT